MTATPVDPIVLRREFARELAHWKAAAERLSNLDAVAPAAAWRALEHYLGVALRHSIDTVLTRLRARIAAIERELAVTLEADELLDRIERVRDAYLKAETTVDFFADALCTRSIPETAALLRACDHLATRSMAEALAPLGRQVPAALTYIDKGLGASILKSGLRLWDGSVDNPVATIKVTRHNLMRPTALVHEAGHQVAHMLGWTRELAAAFAAHLDRPLGVHWAAYASEVAADAFAHVHTGFAATAALHDVIDGADAAVFRFSPGDPHPVAYIRLLLGTAMCRRSFGAGPWDPLAATWTVKHPLARCPAAVQPLLRASQAALPDIVELILYRPYRAFGGRPLTALIDPARVSPQRLERLAAEIGSSMTSPYWMWNEAIRLMALYGYRAGLGPSELQAAVRQQAQWMVRLGTLSAAA